MWSMAEFTQSDHVYLDFALLTSHLSCLSVRSIKFVRGMATMAIGLRNDKMATAAVTRGPACL